MEWQDISTAPKDGTPILAHSETLGPVIVLYSSYGGGHLTSWTTLWDGDLLANEPTHWMPLPPPPASAATASAPGTVNQP